MMLALFLCLVSLSLPAMAEKKISVVATTFPIYDWARQVIGDTDSVDLIMLLDSGVDLHSFNPTAVDIMKIANCDLFIYVGGESDDWVEDALKQAINPNMTAISLMEQLGEAAKEEEAVEGMEDADDEEEAEYDEHIWLSLRNASLFTQVICDALSQKDAANAEAYRANAEAYREKLAALDVRYAEMAEGASYKTLLFGDRFPFRYMVDDYGLSYYAAFKGCSAETEASFKTVVFLAGKVDELGLPAVMTIEGTNHRIAETIVQSTKNRDQRILAVNSMQSVTSGDVKQGADYLDIMEKNLEIFRTALN
ncbi:MAG: zinc ABC transporter substrate-binding protein [Clostridia bacterium]|nr:zinc ABC transporter substrate-binding protein [Clostridia bacterium]